MRIALTVVWPRSEGLPDDVLSANDHARLRIDQAMSCLAGLSRASAQLGKQHALSQGHSCSHVLPNSPRIAHG